MKYCLAASRFSTRTALAVIALALSGCAGSDITTEDSTVGLASAALTPAESVLDFEVATDWTATSGVVEATTVRSHGAAALSLRGFGYSELRSAPLSNLSGVTSELAIDVRTPVSANWGQIQLYASSPTLGLYDTFVGQASLAGLPAGTFTELVFPLTDAVKTALSGNYADLRIKLVLNVPYTTAAYIVDNLHFRGGSTPTCGAGSPYTLVVTGESDLDPSILEDMKCTFYTVYPQLVARFNPAAATTVGMHFVDDPGVAWTIGSDTYYNLAAMSGHPKGTDVVVHEIMHVVQGGYSGEVRSWVIEGTADYVRDAYGLRNSEFGWVLPTGYVYGQHYRSGYGVTAAFFKWIDANYRQGLLPVADALDDIMRQGQYSGQTWVTLTGYDVDTLWRQYSNGVAPMPATSGITVYGDGWFGGEATVLDRGSYDVADMGARGIPNDWLSSIRVPAGYRVTVYPHSPFEGTPTVYTQDIDFVGAALNDTASSIVVE